MKIIQGKAAFVGDMRVSEERDVGDGIVADEEMIFRQVGFHDSQRLPTSVASGFDDRCALRRIGLVLQPKAGGSDVWFVAVLLEGHPLKDQSPRFSIIGKIASSTREISQDRVGLS